MGLVTPPSMEQVTSAVTSTTETATSAQGQEDPAHGTGPDEVPADLDFHQARLRRWPAKPAAATPCKDDCRDECKPGRECES
jgi:hypothetical protein